MLPQELTSPRLIKSHLPYRFLPTALHEGEAKVSAVKMADARGRYAAHQSRYSGVEEEAGELDKISYLDIDITNKINKNEKKMYLEKCTFIVFLCFYF